MFRTSNPTLRDKVFQNVTGVGQMTLGGTMAKTGILFLLLLATAAYGFTHASLPLLAVGALGGLGLCIATCIKPQWAPVTAPLYALAEGLAVGVFSLVANDVVAHSNKAQQYGGIIPMAIFGTLVVFFVMLALYATRIIKVTQTFVGVVVGATLAIALTYLATFVIGFFWKGVYDLGMYGSGPMGLLFSCIVIVVAALNLALDFRIIENGVTGRAPKFMEWYAGFGLMVTLVWLYIEILRLLMKLSSRR